MGKRSQVNFKNLCALIYIMDFNSKNTSEGSISEWNEGNFKNLRLHEAQEWINAGKVSPFEPTEDKTKMNYQIWKAGIDILYGEGQSKYSDDEIKEVNDIKDLVESMIEMKPPVRKITEHSINGKRDKLTPIPENQKRIKKYLEVYEEIVKKHNDAHGLSTRNRDEEDIKGL